MLPALLRPAAALGGAGARIRSRSISASPPNTAIINRPMLVPVSAHSSASERNWRLGVHNLLDDAEQIKGAARKAVNARHRHHVAGREGVQYFEELAAVGVRSRHLLAINIPVG